jgi:hypothetical protein
MTKQRTLVFEGPGRHVEVLSGEWAEMLVLLEDWGWQPEQRRVSYLAAGVEVSDPDARNLATVGQSVLDAALKDPLAVYPVSFDMGKFWEVIEFCKAGGFRSSQ